jgi:hypothetical protein
VSPEQFHSASDEDRAIFVLCGSEDEVSPLFAALGLYKIFLDPKEPQDRARALAILTQTRANIIGTTTEVTS